MRIKTITDKFVNRKQSAGCYMQVRNQEGVTTIRYRLSGNPIAEIYDYKDSNNYRLRVYPCKERYGRNGHNNRVGQILRSVQMIHDRDWANIRYDTFIHYSLRVHDRKLNAEYVLEKYPLELVYRDGKLMLDYQSLESHAYEDESPTPVVIIEPNANSNLASVSNKLTAILAGV
jgi:hypothetical protein